MRASFLSCERIYLLNPILYLQWPGLYCLLWWTLGPYTIFLCWRDFVMYSWGVGGVDGGTACQCNVYFVYLPLLLWFCGGVPLCCWMLYIFGWCIFSCTKRVLSVYLSISKNKLSGLVISQCSFDDLGRSNSRASLIWCCFYNQWCTISTLYGWLPLRCWFTKQRVGCRIKIFDPLPCFVS